MLVYRLRCKDLAPLYRAVRNIFLTWWAAYVWQGSMTRWRFQLAAGLFKAAGLQVSVLNQSGRALKNIGPKNNAIEADHFVVMPKA